MESTTHNRGVRLLILLASTLLTLAVVAWLAPAPSEAFSKTAKRGGWSATVTYKRKSGHGPYAFYRRMRVTIKHGRKFIVKRRTVTAPNRYTLVSMGPPSWRVANLDGDVEPEFILTWMPGCTHSCTQINAFGIGKSRAATLPVTMPDGFSVRDLNGDGVSELVGADHRFSYKFASYASSGNPLLVNSLAGGVVQDVTRSFPAQIEQDAAGFLERWNQGAQYSDGGGVALGYAANLCRLGRSSEALDFLNAAEDSTTVPNDLDLSYDGEYAEKAFEFLKSVGYC